MAYVFGVKQSEKRGLFDLVEEGAVILRNVRN
jgi:hypothetical protein